MDSACCHLHAGVLRSCACTWQELHEGGHINAGVRVRVRACVLAISSRTHACMHCARTCAMLPLPFLSQQHHPQPGALTGRGW